MFTLRYPKHSNFERFAISCIPLMQKIGGSSITRPAVTDKKISFCDNTGQGFFMTCEGGHENFNFVKRRTELLAQAIIIHAAIEYNGYDFITVAEHGNDGNDFWEEAGKRYEECTGIKVQIKSVDKILYITRF